MLSAEGIFKKYNIPVLKGLSFKVNKGDIYGFLGVNGSGKSTSLKILLNLVKSDSGLYRFKEKEIIFGDYKYLQFVGALIERPDFYEYISARKNLEILAQYFPEKIEKFRIDEVLEFVGL